MGDFKKKFPISTNTADIKVAAEEWEIMEALVAAMAKEGKVTESFKIDRKKVWDPKKREELIQVLGKDVETKIVEDFLKQTDDRNATRHSFMVMVDKDKYPPNGYKIYAMARGKLEGVLGTGGFKLAKALVARDGEVIADAIVDADAQAKSAPNEIATLGALNELKGTVTVAAKPQGAVTVDAKPIQHPDQEVFLDFVKAKHREENTAWVGKRKIKNKQHILQDLQKGMTLFQYINKQKTPDFLTNLKIAQSVCAQVKILHETGLVHRDIKPENIMISFDDKDVPTAQLIDYGFARNIDEATLGQGTPGYAAPFLYYKEGLDIIHASIAVDIYALGMVLSTLRLIGSNPNELRAAMMNEDDPTKDIHERLADLIGTLLLTNSRMSLDVPFAYKDPKYIIRKLIREMLKSTPTVRPQLSEVLAEIKKAIAAVEARDKAKADAAAPAAPGPLRFSSGAKPVSTNSLASFASSAVGVGGVQHVAAESDSPLPYGRRDGSMDELDPPSSPKLT